jgi:pimeloyl-ACP methyl ester carboxylesterase
MTLNALQLWRKAIPFVIAVVCVVPWIVIRAQDLREGALILTLAFGTAFLYVILKISGPRWENEMENYVRSQIRDNLITLIPEELNVTAAEREQLANSEILKVLTGIFWETIDQTEMLRSQKQHFYSNGFAYSTAVDGFVLCIIFGLCYVMAWLIFTDIKLLASAIGLIGVGLICRWLAIPRIRQGHLALSREQLALLKRERGDIVADRFRQIVLEWRAQGRPGVTPADPQKHAVLWTEGFAGFFVVIAFSALAVMSRGWFGPGVKLATEVKSEYVSEGSHNRFAAVVFVHGIFGTKEDTWLSRGPLHTFPELLSNDPDLKDRVDVFAFEYFSPKFGAGPSIVDLDDQLRGALDDNQIFENHQKIVFLAHSMGGIVVRHFLLNHQDRIEKVPMVFFYATPTNGSEMASVGHLVSINPQLRGMVPIEGNDLLQSIQSGWLNSEKAKSIASYCAVEELPTLGVTIVTRSSATSLCNRALDPFSANHIDIVKPTDRKDPRYTRFVSALQKEVLAPNFPSTPQITSPETSRQALDGNLPQWIPINATYGHGSKEYLPRNNSPSCGVYDEEANELILFGGYGLHGLSDNRGYGPTNGLWVLSHANGLDGAPSSWTQLILNNASGSPQPRYNHTVVFDGSDRRLIVFGGCLGGCLPVGDDVWIAINADGSGGQPPTWMQPTVVGKKPPPRMGAVGAYEAGSNSMTIFGGHSGGGPTSIGGSKIYFDVWVLRNANGLEGDSQWTELFPGDHPPPGGYLASAVYDAGSDSMILFGGLGEGTSGVTNGVWRLSYADGQGGAPTWKELVPNGAKGSPPPRGGAGAVYDPRSNQMVIFGGEGEKQHFNDVWLLANANGMKGVPKWTQIRVGGAEAPNPRVNAVVGYDPSHNRMIVFGGDAFDFTAWVLSNISAR